MVESFWRLDAPCLRVVELPSIPAWHLRLRRHTDKDPPDDIPDFIDEQRITRQLERLGR